MIGPATSSGNLTTSTQVYSMPGFLHGIEINPPATGTALVNIYDGTSSGNLLIATATCAAGQNSIQLTFLCPRVLNKGLYAQLTGTTNFVVAFSPG